MTSEQKAITPIIPITAAILENKIFTIRNSQVMLDSDLADIYGVETKSFNRAVTRNENRFPESFRFQLTLDEYDALRCQIGTSKSRGGRRYLPYVFSEQGISMLSAVLRSETAIKISIQIINAFVDMRKFLASKNSLLNRVALIEFQQIQNEQRFNTLFTRLEDKTITTKQGIFYDGQIHDAYHFVNELIRSAKISITIIDNYIDDSVLTMLSKRSKDVTATIYTAKITKQLQLDLDKYHQQYAVIKVHTFKQAHDRFVIIDNQDVYHVGASLKDLGKKWFAFSKMQMPASEILNKLGAKK